MAKLTAAKVRTLDKPGMHGDGAGLYLRIAPGGSKQWIHRATIGGKRCEMGLGAYSGVTLAKARDEAQAIRAAIAAGRDPLAEKRKAKMPTFTEAADALHNASLPGWRNGKHTAQWRQTLRLYADPVLGDMTVDAIGREAVLRCLTPIWTAKPETARRVRQRIRAVMKWAAAHGHIEHNPAGEIIDGALPTMPKVKAHHAALPYADIADALARIDESRAWPATRLCVRFIALTACRSGEARGATWAEIGPRGGDMDGSGRTHEGEPAAPSPAERRGAGDAARGAALS